MNTTDEFVNVSMPAALFSKMQRNMIYSWSIMDTNEVSLQLEEDLTRFMRMEKGAYMHVYRYNYFIRDSCAFTLECS